MKAGLHYTLLKIWGQLLGQPRLFPFLGEIWVSMTQFFFRE